MAEAPAAAEAASTREYTLPPGSVALAAHLSWACFGGKSVDMDVSVMAFDTYAAELEVAFYNNKEICSGAVRHSGDSTGKSEENSETIEINLAALPPMVRSLYFLVNAQGGATFRQVETGQVQLFLNGAECYAHMLAGGFVDEEFFFLKILFFFSK